jgi:hypothetical protein
VLPDVAACNTGTQQQCNRFLAAQHLRRRITYQPASRFWAFQADETAIFVVLSLTWPGSASGGSLDLREVDGHGESAGAGHGRGGPPLRGDIRG